MAEGGVSPVPREARGYQGHRAGVVSRLTAAVIDTAVVALGLVAAYLAGAGLLFLIDPRSFELPAASWLFSITTALVAMALYLTVAWSLAGRTYGFHLMGLRLLGPEGETPGPTRAFLRAVLYVLFPVGLLWCAVSRESSSVQDLLVRTRVVYDWQPRAMHHEQQPGT
jgi:uncharacterized RDD family membrane protein YckC